MSCIFKSVDFDRRIFQFDYKFTINTSLLIFQQLEYLTELVTCHSLR